jgi:hypothetical protein
METVEHGGATARVTGAQFMRQTHDRHASLRRDADSGVPLGSGGRQDAFVYLCRQ